MVQKWSWSAAVCAIAAVVVLAASSSSAAAGQTADVGDRTLPRKLVVVVANRLILSDFTDPQLRLPNISRLIREGALGLISPNCEHPRTEAAVLMTASAGYRCPGSDFLNEFYDSDESIPSTNESAAEAFRIRTGRIGPQGAALFLGYGPALRLLREQGLLPQFGRIGDAVHLAGGKTCVIGNADLDQLQPNRAYAVLAVDSDGIIDIGLLHVSGRQTVGCLPGIDVDLLVETTLKCLDRADLIVLNFGESTILDAIKMHLSDTAYQTHRKSMLRRLDKLVGRLIEAERRSLCDAVVLASFSVPKNGYWNRLTPILVWSPESKHKLLTSVTTRTAGLLAASDFPGLVEGLQCPHLLYRNRNLCSGSFDTVRRLDARVYANHTLLMPIGWVFGATAALSLTAASVTTAFRLRVRRILRSAILIGLLTCLVAPLAMLVAVLGPPSVWLYAAITIGVAVTAGVLSRIAFRRSAVAVLFGLTALAVIIDALTGCNLCKFALPSSFQLEGYRYYGVGNEYAAVLICACALLLLVAGRARRAGSAAALGAVVVSVLGFGRLGSNLGGAAAAVVTFCLMYVALRNGRFRARHIVGAFAAALAVGATLAWADWALFGDSSSHGGKLVSIFLSRGESSQAPLFGGFRGVLLLAARKCLMNLRITISEHAQNAYITFAPFIALWLWKAQPRLAMALTPDDRANAGLKALVVGAIATFILNDSGIVMAAIMLGMTAAALLYILLEQDSDGENCCS